MPGDALPEGTTPHEALDIEKQDITIGNGVSPPGAPQPDSLQDLLLWSPSGDAVLADLRADTASKR
jgi:hypothetical protein